MEENFKATHHYDHLKISKATGLDLGYIRQLSVKLGDILSSYRVSGDKGVYLYNHNGFLVWQEIAKLRRQGQTPKTIKNHLRKTFKSESKNNKIDKGGSDSLVQWMQGDKEPSKKVGDEVVPRFVYENTRADLKSEILDQREQLKGKDKFIKELQEQLRFLPAPDEWKRKTESESRARAETIKLLKELKELEEKRYGWFDGGERKANKARIIEIVHELDELNMKH